MAREVLPSNSRAQQLDTIGMQVDQLRPVRGKMKTSGQEFDSALGGASKLVNSFGEIYTAAVTADNGVAASLENPIVPWSLPSGINPERKYAHQVAVMTGTLLTNDFEVLVRSRETVVEDINWEQGQLTEVLVVEHQHQRLMEERWNPVTTAVKNVDNAMIDEMLREIEELDEPHKLSDEDDAFIDALLEDLELENKDQARGERSVVLEMQEVTVHGVYKESGEGTCDVTKATGRSEADIEAEGKCFFPSTEAKDSLERHWWHTLDEAIPQRPALTRSWRFWVPHRKHCRRRTENQQMGLQRLCWPTHRKNVRWKVDQKMGQSPRLQLRSDGARRWCSQRKRVKWKSENRLTAMRA